jgi:hypothetical protein
MNRAARLPCRFRPLTPGGADQRRAGQAAFYADGRELHMAFIGERFIKA